MTRAEQVEARIQELMPLAKEDIARLVAESEFPPDPDEAADAGFAGLQAEFATAGAAS